MTPRRPSSAALVDAEDETILVEALFSATRAFRQRLRPELEREGISAPMFWTLHQLVVEGPMHVGEIATACVVTPANVSGSVDDLVRAGLVVRRPGLRDRRVVVVTATSRGRSLHRAVWRGLGRVLVGSLGAVPREELAATARVLGRLAAPPLTPSALTSGSGA